MKKPRPGGGVFGICSDDEVSLVRAKNRGPRMGTFFRDDGARLRDHLQMMRGMPGTVNTRGGRMPDATEKKPDPKGPA